MMDAIKMTASYEHVLEFRSVEMLPTFTEQANSIKASIETLMQLGDFWTLETVRQALLILAKHDDHSDRMERTIANAYKRMQQVTT